jgi:hypothetical protein
MFAIIHTHADGTVFHGDPRPHQHILKDNGFTYRSSVGWFIRGSRDHDARSHRIDAVVAGFAALGAEVAVDIDDTPRPVAEREADRADRLEARQDALRAKADRLGYQADTLHQRARDMAGVIPFGQPILIGHHSEGRDRNYRRRIGNTFDRAAATATEAEEAARRADASRADQSRRDSLPVTLRRIERLEADARRVERELAGASCPTSGRQPRPDADLAPFVCPLCGTEVAVNGVVAEHFGRGRAPATGKREARLRHQLDQLNSDLDYWRAHAAGRQAAGEKAWGPGDFAKGDVVNGHCTVVRVNRKSLTVQYHSFPDGMTNPLAYSKVRSVEKKEG